MGKKIIKYTPTTQDYLKIGYDSDVNKLSIYNNTIGLDIPLASGGSGGGDTYTSINATANSVHTSFTSGNTTLTIGQDGNLTIQTNNTTEGTSTSTELLSSSWATHIDLTSVNFTANLNNEGSMYSMPNISEGSSRVINFTLESASNVDYSASLAIIQIDSCGATTDPTFLEVPAHPTMPYNIGSFNINASTVAIALVYVSPARATAVVQCNVSYDHPIFIDDLLISLSGTKANKVPAGYGISFRRFFPGAYFETNALNLNIKGSPVFDDLDYSYSHCKINDATTGYLAYDIEVNHMTQTIKMYGSDGTIIYNLYQGGQWISDSTLGINEGKYIIADLDDGFTSAFANCLFMFGNIQAVDLTNALLHLYRSIEWTGNRAQVSADLNGGEWFYSIGTATSGKLTFHKSTDANGDIIFVSNWVQPDESTSTLPTTSWVETFINDKIGYAYDETMTFSQPTENIRMVDIYDRAVVDVLLDNNTPDSAYTQIQGLKIGIKPSLLSWGTASTKISVYVSDYLDSTSIIQGDNFVSFGIDSESGNWVPTAWSTNFGWDGTTFTLDTNNAINKKIVVLYKVPSDGGMVERYYKEVIVEDNGDEMIYNMKAVAQKFQLRIDGDTSLDLAKIRLNGDITDSLQATTKRWVENYVSNLTPYQHMYQHNITLQFGDNRIAFQEITSDSTSYQTTNDVGRSLYEHGFIDGDNLFHTATGYITASGDIMYYGVYSYQIDDTYGLRVMYRQSDGSRGYDEANGVSNDTVIQIS